MEAHLDTTAPSEALSPLCPMPGTCAQVGSCLYPASACLTGPTAANDLSGERACTCHPSDSPPVPCAQKFALAECKATSQPEGQSQ